MGLMLVLTHGREIEVGPGNMGTLAGLGVTTVSVVSGDGLRGIVLQGWAFDPGESAAEVREILGDGEDIILLLPELQFAVQGTGKEGR